ncbi:MAG: TonB-dependent receptor [Acidobacteriota bacterium]|nr:TonB-dependent receptor [Acidobacteriota bacterium]
MIKVSLRQFVIFAVLAALSIPAGAQTVTGTINGTVTDKSGGALPGVTVTIRNADTGLERVVVTDKAGFYNATFLPVGLYNVHSELSGFGGVRHNNVRVDLNQTVVQDFILDPAMQETVTVAADAPRIDVSDGEVKQTLRAKEIANLPAPDQTNFLRLASVFAGFQENSTSGQDNPALSSGSSVNFNGTGTRGATFQINGVNNDDTSENQHRQNVPVATIQSFQILTNNYSAEFGRGYGAVVLVQTKQGTNNIDGEVYGYGQDAKYQTRDPGQTSLNHGKHYRRQFGATAGFPIMRDTLFGYLNVDQVQDKGDIATLRGTFLPSDLDPAKRLTLGNDTPANRAWQDSIIARFPKAPNAPNLGARAYLGFQIQNVPKRDAAARLDFNGGARNSLTARYQRSHQEMHAGELIIGEEAGQVTRQSNFGLTWTNMLSSDTVQEARIGIGLRNTAWTITDDPNTPVVRMGGGSGVPLFTILGNAGAFPIIRNQRDDQLVYNISSTRWTRHTLKLGTDLRRSNLNDRADNFNRGFWSFSATCAANPGVNYGTAIAAFWAGCVNTFTKSFGPNYLQNKLTEENVYAQDDWRPTDNLVLNLGARYENVAPPKERNNLVNYGFKSSSYFDPRLGFAYTPNWDRNGMLRALTGGNGQFSIRGGFGIFHGRVFQSVFSQGGASIRYNPPNAATIAQSSTNLSDPLNGFVFVPGQVTTRVAATFADPNLKMPEARQWNLTFERQAFWNSRLRASYIGTYGKNLLQYRWDNVPVAPAPAGTAGATWVVAADAACAGTGTVAGIAVSAACPNVVPIAANEVSLRVPRTNERRPDARFSDVRIVSNLAESWYHAGQLEWETGEYHGFTGRATYTYGKALDTGAETTDQTIGDVGIFPARDGRFDYAKGYSRFDVRHRVTAAGAYSLPWLKNRSGLIGSALGGWTVATVIRYASGTPTTVVDSGAPDVLFLGNGMKPNRPICVDPKYCSGSITSPADNGKTPVGAFRHAVYGDTLTSFIGRNTYRVDGAQSVDAGLYKTFTLPAALALVVRLDCFNVFNWSRWYYPSMDINNPSTFGTVTTTSYLTTSSPSSAPSALSPPRMWQLGFRIIY